MNRKILCAPSVDSKDATAFVELVAAHPLFDRDHEIVIARAPGRLDLMGGIADYSGSLVLQWPLGEATLVAAQVAGEGAHLVSLGPESGRERSSHMALADLFPGGGQPMGRLSRECHAFGIGGGNAWRSAGVDAWRRFPQGLRWHH